MTENDFCNQILNDFGITISNKQRELLNLFSDLLLDYNLKVNITSIKNKKEVYLKHFYDSLSIVKIIDLNNVESLLDVGSGGGFPGIVLKIFFPNVSITLLDSNHKKSDFQRYICDKLNLDNIIIVNDRAENFYLLVKKYDIVVARAVARMNVLTELCLPFSKIGGYFIAMKGNAEEEIKEAKKSIEMLGGKTMDIIDFKMPYNAGNRTIIKVLHEKVTPVNYPRSYDKILKKPLK